MADIPAPRNDDPDDVSLALEVAKAQWAKGDSAEAIKWLRKAADAAFDAGDDRRGIELSKSAAELQSAKPKKPFMPAPMPPSPPTRPPPPPTHPPPPPSTRLGPQPIPPSRPTQPPPPPPVKMPKPVVPTRTSSPELGKAKHEQPAKPHLAKQEQPAKPPPPAKPEHKPAAPPKVATAKKAAAKGKTEETTQTGKRRAMKSHHDDDEATREIEVKALVREAPKVIEPSSPTLDADDWPTETISTVEELGAILGPSTKVAEAPKREEPAKQVRGHEPTQEFSPDRGMVPKTTQAVRVAVSRGNGGTIVVRVVDETGLRNGEFEAMLVAMSPDTDLAHLIP